MPSMRNTTSCWDLHSALQRRRPTTPTSQRPTARCPPRLHWNISSFLTPPSHKSLSDDRSRMHVVSCELYIFPICLDYVISKPISLYSRCPFPLFFSVFAGYPYVDYFICFAHTPSLVFVFHSIPLSRMARVTLGKRRD